MSADELRSAKKLMFVALNITFIIVVLLQESLDHESRAGSVSGQRYWAHPPEEAAGPSGVGQPHPSPGNLGNYPLAPPTAPSLQALMKTNPGILKTIQVNEPQPGWCCSSSVAGRIVVSPCHRRACLVVVSLWSPHNCGRHDCWSKVWRG